MVYESHVYGQFTKYTADWMRRCNKNKDAAHQEAAATSNKPSPRNTTIAGLLKTVSIIFSISNIFNPLILSRQGIKVSTLTKYSKHARNLLVIHVVR